MFYLLLSSLLWSLSFGMIKTHLLGIPPLFLGGIRALLALFLFFPFFFFFPIKKLKFRGLAPLKYMFIGLLEYGLPYALYLHSYQYLKAYQIALFLTFTPFYVTLFSDIFNRQFSRNNFLAALLAIIGASLINFSSGEWGDVLIGFILLQFADMGFALGQVLYKRWSLTAHPEKNQIAANLSFIPWIILGGFLTLLIMDLFLTNSFATMATSGITFKQWIIILYLGIGSTGVAYLSWNIGIQKVSAGMLAVMNNLKIPLAVVWSLTLFGESNNLSLPQFLVGTPLILVAIYLVQPKIKKSNKENTIYEI